MYIPSDNAANFTIAAVSAFPGTVFAISLSQTDVALLGIVVNVFLAIGLKLIDVLVRHALEARNARKAAAKKEAGE